MPGIRRRLRLVATVWLVLQFALLASAPASLCSAPRADAEPSAMAACTCAHGEGPMMCPMHHARTVPDSRSCSCRAARDPLTAVLAALCGPAAVLTRVLLPAEPAAGASGPLAAHVPLQAVVVPDPRPPRA